MLDMDHPYNWKVEFNPVSIESVVPSRKRHLAFLGVKEMSGPEVLWNSQNSPEFYIKWLVVGHVPNFDRYLVIPHTNWGLFIQRMFNWGWLR